MTNIDNAYRERLRMCSHCDSPTNKDDLRPVKGRDTTFHAKCWKEHCEQLAPLFHREPERPTKKPKEKKWMKCPYCTAWGALGITAIIFVVSVLSWLAFSSLTASGKVTYCYVEYDSRAGFQLQGSREWRVDLEMGRYPNAAEAVKAADVIHCPLQYPTGVAEKE